MKSKQVLGLIKESESRTEQRVARMSLSALRNMRDEAPDAWDALMKDDKAGSIMLALWDYLRDLER